MATQDGTGLGVRGGHSRGGLVLSGEDRLEKDARSTKVITA